MCGCLLCTPHKTWGPGLQPRHLPWLESNQQCFRLRAHAQSTELHQSGVLIDFRERGKEGERKIDCCSTYLHIHWLIFLYALTRGWTHDLGIWGQHFNQLSYPARTDHLYFLFYLILASKFCALKGVLSYFTAGKCWKRKTVWEPH